ncbi:MAG: peptide deformylase [Oscillospiraceae bacterium]|jgi:peptide deformylase|nr:peptide deformylase [Oscillospiraceae bacterium]
MAIRKIIKGGDPILNKKSRVVEKFDDRLAQLLDDMIQTMHAAKGCGLAAVQVGVLKRAVVVDTGDGVVELINPEIIDKKGVQREQEGCLSFPGEYGVCIRPAVVKLRAQNRRGQWCFYKAEGLKARAFCHEVDHLDGVVFKDRWIKAL